MIRHCNINYNKTKASILQLYTDTLYQTSETSAKLRGIRIVT